MKYRTWTLCLLLLLVIGVFNGFSLPEEMVEPSRLEIDAFEAPRRPGSIFDHDAHNEKAGLDDNCAVCHHVYEDGVLVEDESSEDSSCSDCHGLRPTDENSVGLEAAFHRQCKECHFESARGPVLCGECHRKN